MYKNWRKNKFQNIWNLLNVNGDVAPWLLHLHFSSLEILVNCSLKRKLVFFSFVQLGWPIPFKIYFSIFFSILLLPSLCVCVSNFSNKVFSNIVKYYYILAINMDCSKELFAKQYKSPDYARLLYYPMYIVSFFSKCRTNKLHAYCILKHFSLRLLIITKF